MSERMLRRIVTALVVLTVIYAAVRLVNSIAGPHVDTGGALGVAIRQLNTDTITSASIAGPSGEQIEIRRAGLGWTANGFPADSIAVARLVQAAAAAKLGPLAARTSTNHAVLGVTDAASWKITVRGAHDSARLLIGTVGTESPSAYVRLPNRDTVYQVLGSLREAVANPIAVWRDRVILRLDTTAVRTVIFDRDHQRFAIERGGKGWQGTTPQDTVTFARLVAVLSELRRLEAIGFATDATPPHGTEARHVVILGAKGDTLAALELLGGGTEWLGRVSGNPQRYLVSSFEADRLIPRREELFPPRKAVH